MHEIVRQLLSYLRGMWQYRWYGVAVGWLVCVVGWAVVVMLPNQYEASARVYVDNGPETFSNSAGSYVLRGVPGSQRLVRARIVQGGIEYYGEQFVRVFDQERSQSVNITVVRDSQRAEIHGRVVDRDGFFVSGARVYAIANALHSTQAITDSEGRFVIDTLLGGTGYQVTASARGFNTETDFVNVPAVDQQ